MNKLINKYSVECIINQINMGAATEAMSAESDDIFKPKATINQTSNKAKATQGLIARITPKAVATPFPPLNEKNTGYKCPKNVAAPTKAIIVGSKSNRLTINTGTKPFKLSPNNVIAAAIFPDFPPILNTLVAPGFFEPRVLGSGNPITRQVIIAEEIEPIR